MDEFIFPKVERAAFSVCSLFGKSDDKSYWLSRTPAERLQAVELMHQIIYGDKATKRFQKVLEVTQRA